LKDANQKYSAIRRRLEEGPARAAFKNQSPEKIINGVLSGSVSETQVADIVRTLQDADRVAPTGMPEGAPDYESNFNKSVLYNQILKHAARVDELGLPTRIDAAGMLDDLTGVKSPIYKKIYGEDYQKIVDSVKTEATRQYQFQRNMTLGKKAAYSLLGLGGLAEIWNVLSGGSR
jgi:hypothetical protein